MASASKPAHVAVATTPLPSPSLVSPRGAPPSLQQHAQESQRQPQTPTTALRRLSSKILKDLGAESPLNDSGSSGVVQHDASVLSAQKMARTLLKGDQLPADLANGDNVLYIASILQLNYRGFPVGRVVVLTHSHLYCLTPVTNRCEHKVPVESIIQTSVSPHWDSIVCLHLAEQLQPIDLVFVCLNKGALIRELQSTRPLSQPPHVVGDAISFRLAEGSERRTLHFSVPEGADTYKAALFVDMVPFENPFVDSLSPSESMELINLDCDGADAEDLTTNENKLLNFQGAGTQDVPEQQYPSQGHMLRRGTFMNKLMNLFGAKREQLIRPMLHQLAVEQEQNVFFRWLSQLGKNSPYPHSLGLTYCIKMYQSPGQRKYMEDVIVFDRNLRHGMGDLMIAIFDGHGGKAVSTWLGQNFRTIMESQYISKKVNKDIQKCLIESFAEAHRRIIAEPWGIDCGSTALVVIIKHDKLFIANAGDCRAVLVGKDSQKALTIDHKVTLETEMERIKGLGGIIKAGRIAVDGGQINLARSLGDKRFLPYLSPEPDFFEVSLDREEHLFLMLGCDGIFDVITNENVGSILRRSGEPSRICAQAFALGSHDNLSAAIVKLQQQGLPNAPSLTPHAQSASPPARSRSGTPISPISPFREDICTPSVSPPPEFIPERLEPTIEDTVVETEDIFGLPNGGAGD